MARRWLIWLAFVLLVGLIVSAQSASLAQEPDPPPPGDLKRPFTYVQAQPPQPDVRLPATNHRAFLPTIILPPVPTNVFDDFSDRTSGWNEIILSRTTFEYRSGEYRIVTGRADTIAFATAGHLAGNFEIAAEMRRVGDALGLYGLVFGSNNREEFHFLVSPDDHNWFLLRFDRSRFRYDSPPLLTGEGNIEDGNDINFLRALKAGDHLTLSVNDDVVFDGNQPTYGGRRQVGVATVSFEENFDARFDNFLVIEKPFEIPPIFDE